MEELIIMTWHRSGHDGSIHPFGCETATVVMPAHSFNRPLSNGKGHPLGLRDYMERPAGVGNDTVDRETAGDGIVVIRDLDAQGDLRWKDVVASLLVHASGRIVRWNTQDQASVVLCGPQVAVPFDFQSDAFTPVLGDDGDPLDHAAASFEGLRCLVRSQRHECLGVLTVWHDERASYEAVLGPRPYERRPVQVIRVGRRLWQGFVPAMFDLFGEKVPDHVCLHLVRRWDNPQPGLTFVPLGRGREEILDSVNKSHETSMTHNTDIGKQHTSR